jgi:drug/metabolite transporter (DMT)-like permease
MLQSLSMLNKQDLLSPHLKAVVQALFVTFLWSTSWVIIKVGLKDIPALTFAGLRYGLAFLCLLPFALRSSQFRQIRKLSSKDWLLLSLLGILFYAVTQGAQFVGLVFLPAVTTSVLLNFTSLVVAVLGILFLDERPTLLQWYGVGLFILGVVFYFFPIQFPAQQLVGILIVLIGVIANAFSSILGRAINRARVTSPLLVTIISMGIGSILLLIGGIGFQGLPGLSLTNWLYIAWLAVVNTAFAFTLWNHTLQELSAMESTVINGTMLIQIAVLAWIFLDEGLNPQEIFGMLLAGIGAVLVQYRRKVERSLSPEPDISTD